MPLERAVFARAKIGPRRAPTCTHLPQTLHTGAGEQRAAICPVLEGFGGEKDMGSVEGRRREEARALREDT